jgi:hypothetical protein
LELKGDGTVANTKMKTFKVTQEVEEEEEEEEEERKKERKKKHSFLSLFPFSLSSSGDDWLSE